MNGNKTQPTGTAAGRLMADLVTGATPVVDPHDFWLGRFSDGSRVRLDSGFRDTGTWLTQTRKLTFWSNSAIVIH
jgi:hypothetical protein